MEFRYKNILLVGAGGKTGRSYSTLLLRRFEKLYAYDANPSVEYSQELIDDKRFIRGEEAPFQDASILEEVDAITLSPGVPLSLPIFQEAAKRKKPVFSELEYCFEALKEATWICVTGTDGKSTTVALLEKLIKDLPTDLQPLACGNYGTPFSQVVLSRNTQKGLILAAELSSYQLELSANLAPDAAIYLNLSPDHLNRYRDLEHYGRTKWNIFRGIKENGICILNKNLHPDTCTLWKGDPTPPRAAGKIETVDTEALNSQTFSWRNGVLYYKEEEIVQAADLKLQGRHNQGNILFALLAVHWLYRRGDFGKIEFSQYIASLKKSLTEFDGLPHRFERIEGADQNIYINDSKATTTQAAITAFQNAAALGPQPINIFLGGQSKGEDYSALRAPLQGLANHIRLYLFGENRLEIERALDIDKLKKGCTTITIAANAPTLKECFDAAKATQNREKIGEMIYLLAPASTSWDQYPSYQERGDHFRRLVQQQDENAIQPPKQEV